jgi:microtubule-associated protein-like 6
MGCSNSTGASEGATSESSAVKRGPGHYEENEDGNEVWVPDANEAGEKNDDGIRINNAGDGQQRGAIDPFNGGQIMEPDNHPPVNPECPSSAWKLHHIFGYRADASISPGNAHWSHDGKVVYPAGALGVVSTTDRDQCYFGYHHDSNQTCPKIVTQGGHHDDVTCLKICAQRKMVATGQIGKKPVLHVWDVDSRQSKMYKRLAVKDKSITAIAISPDASIVGCTEGGDEHNTYFYNVADGSLLFCDSADKSNKINDMAFCPTNKRAVTVGQRHIKFWDMSAKKCEKGLQGDMRSKVGKYGDSYKAAAFDKDGVLYTAGYDGCIWTWKDRNMSAKTEAHKGVIGCISYMRDSHCLATGGKDGNCMIWDIAAGLTQKHCMNVGNWVSSLDCFNNQFIVGDRSGTLAVYADKAKQCEITRGHSVGETWAASFASNGAVTGGDDNQILCYDFGKKETSCVTEICSKSSNPDKNGASTQPDARNKFGQSQYCRAICSVGDCHFYGTCAGEVVKVENGQVACRRMVSKRWIEAMSACPDGSKIAVGDHDSKVIILNASDLTEVACGKAHKSFITAVDWSCDGAFVRSVDGAYELLFHDAATGAHKNSPSEFKGTEWASGTCKIMWETQGLFDGIVDFTNINTVDISCDKSLVVSGDDSGLVKFYNNPARPGAKCLAMRAHCSHVVRTRFNAESNCVISTGGNDKTMMVWMKC